MKSVSRIRRPAARAAGIVVVTAAAVVSVSVPVAVAPAVVHAQPATVVALYQMSEPAGSTVLVDSSGNGLNGTIGNEVVEGQVQGTTTYHTFPRLSPGAPPPTHPGHLDVVEDSPLLDAGEEDFAVTIRYRTTRNFGNIVQKGQNGTVGGYFKFEGPNGIVSCLFKGSMGEQRTANSVTSLADGQWHVVKCERTSASVTMFVDGVMTSRLTGSTGTISNSRELTIAGKGNCDQIEVTCDYFGGDIDYVRIEKGAGGPANANPTASFTSSCTMLACTFNGSASSDSDGQIHAYSWNFGDGGKAIGPTASHTYVASGTYPVKLTVVDDRGGIGSVTHNVTVTGTSQNFISFVGKASSTGNLISHSVQLPTSVVAGDALILLYSINTNATMSSPTGGVTGWTTVGATTSGLAQTKVWRKVASAADPGKTVRIDLSKQSKGSLILLVYRGTNTTNPVATFASSVPTGSSASRVTPVVNVAGTKSWVISYWMHGDSTTTALTPPGGVTSRASGTQTGGGRVTTLAADSNAVVPSGNYGGLTATAAAASTTASTWTIVLAAKP